MRIHLRHIFIVTIFLLAVSLAGATKSWIGRVMAAGAADPDSSALAYLASYMGYRALDNLSLVFPIGFVLGILWTAIGLIYSRHAVSLRVAGIPVTRDLVPVVILGIAAALAQFAFDNGVTPFAMAKQIEYRLGEYGRRYSRGLTRRAIWIDAGDTLINARVDRSRSPGFRDIAVYRFKGDGTVSEIIKAVSAAPATTGDHTKWLLKDVARWPVGEASMENPAADISAPRRFEPVRLPETVVDLGVDWTLVPYHGIAPEHLRLGAVRRAAVADSAMFEKQKYQTAFHNRISRALMPGLIGVLSMLLFYAAMTRFGLAASSIIAVGSAYIAFAVSRLLGILGQFGALPPVLAGWLLPAIIGAAIIAGIVLRRRDERRFEWLAPVSRNQADQNPRFRDP